MTYNELHGKTDEERFREFPTIEPEYSPATALAEKVMSQFEAEHFKPLLKLVADHVTEHLWDIFRDHIISDTEMNVAGHIRDRIERSVQALLTGERWALEKYALNDRYDGKEIRASIARHIPIELQEKRLAELQEENDRLKKDLQWERERR